MKFKILFLFIFLISCTSTTSIKNKQTHSSKGFAYIFNQNDFQNKIVNKKYDNFELLIAHKYLKPGTLIKLTNPENKISISLVTKNRVKYPSFYNILITEKVADKIKLNRKVPYLEIEEIKRNKSFVADKAKTFKEEQKVFNNAPVQNIKIDDISKVGNQKEKKVKIKQFKILLGEFYSKESAIMLKARLLNEISNYNEKKLTITKISKNNYHLTSGPYRVINLLKKDYIELKRFGFEDLDIKLYE